MCGDGITSWRQFGNPDSLFDIAVRAVNAIGIVEIIQLTVFLEDAGRHCVPLQEQHEVREAVDMLRSPGWNKSTSISIKQCTLAMVNGDGYLSDPVLEVLTKSFFGADPTAKANQLSLRFRQIQADGSPAVEPFRNNSKVPGRPAPKSRTKHCGLDHSAQAALRKFVAPRPKSRAKSKPNSSPKAIAPPKPNPAAATA